MIFKWTTTHDNIIEIGYANLIAQPFERLSMKRWKQAGRAFFIPNGIMIHKYYNEGCKIATIRT